MRRFISYNFDKTFYELLHSKAESKAESAGRLAVRLNNHIQEYHHQLNTLIIFLLIQQKVCIIIYYSLIIDWVLQPQQINFQIYCGVLVAQ